MKSPEEIKDQLEKETGLKVSIKIHPTSSSMRGHISFTTKKQKGEFTEWDFNYSIGLRKQFNQPEPHPTFANRYQLSIHFGPEAYNHIKVKKKNSVKQPKPLTHIQSIFVPKGMRDEKHFIGYTTNYGRPKGVKGSVMGSAPNVVHNVYELNEENLRRYANSLNFVYLCDGGKHIIR